MAISATDVFDIIEEYVRKNHETVEKIRMPYCSIEKDYQTKEKNYRIELRIRLKDESFDRSAIAKVDAENGNIVMYQDGKNWAYWS